MDISQILISMESRPRRQNRENREFVESVGWESRLGGLETSMQKLRNFILMVVIRGVYVDCDLGNYDTVVYLANMVVFRYVTMVPDFTIPDFRNAVATPDKVRDVADNALFIAGFMPNIKKKKPGLGKDFYAFVGKEGYAVISAVAKSRAHHRRFRELSANFGDYASSLEHTANAYLRQ